MTTFYSLKMVGWDDESQRAKDQIYDVPSIVFSTRAKAEEMALVWANEALKDYYEGYEKPGAPTQLISLGWDKEDPNMAYVLYDEQGDAGFWIHFFEMKLDPEL